MRKRRYLPAVFALAAVTVAGASVGQAWAYFTTYAEAAGGYTIRLGDRTEIREDFSDWTKHVVIDSQEGSQPVYVRARAFCGSQYELVYSGDGWTQAGDYYYYNDILYGGQETNPLDIRIEGIPETPDKDYFNVIVIYESVPVQYHEDGTAFSIQETDWSQVLDTGSTEAGSAEDHGSAEGGDEA
nr:hypothetical protein [uncultured Acetatifactor sp.]